MGPLKGSITYSPPALLIWANWAVSESQIQLWTRAYVVVWGGPADQKAKGCRHARCCYITFQNSGHVLVMAWPHVAHTWCRARHMAVAIFCMRHGSVTRHLSSARSSLEVCGSPRSHRLYNRQIQSSITPLFPIISTLHISAYLPQPASPPSPQPPLHSSSPLSEGWNLQLAICQSLPCPATIRMYIYTHAHTNTCWGIQTARAAVVYNDR